MSSAQSFHFSTHCQFSTCFSPSRTVRNGFAAQNPRDKQNYVPRVSLAHSVPLRAFHIVNTCETFTCLLVNLLYNLYIQYLWTASDLNPKLGNLLPCVKTLAPAVLTLLLDTVRSVRLKAAYRTYRNLLGSGTQRESTNGSKTQLSLLSPAVLNDRLSVIPSGNVEYSRTKTPQSAAVWLCLRPVYVQAE